MTDKNKNTKKKVLTGKVVKVIDEKTAAVEVLRTYRHPTYLKVVKQSKKYLIHCEKDVEVGDRVEIVETKPISKRKHFKLVEVLD